MKLKFNLTCYFSVNYVSFQKHREATLVIKIRLCRHYGAWTMLANNLEIFGLSETYFTLFYILIF